MFLIRTEFDKRATWIKLAFLCVVSLFAVLPDQHEITYILSRHIFAVGILFGLLFTGVFYTKLLPIINESSVIIMTITLLFVLFSHGDLANTYVLTGLTVPLLGVTILACTNWHLKGWWRFGAYVWFLICLLVLSVYGYPWHELDYLSGTSSITTWQVIQSLSSGAAFMYVILYVWCVVMLIPIPTKNKFSDRIREWRTYIAFLQRQYTHDQLPVRYNFVLIGVYGGLLTLNYFFRFVPLWFVLNGAFLLLQGMRYVAVR